MFEPVLSFKYHSRNVQNFSNNAHEADKPNGRHLSKKYSPPMTIPSSGKSRGWIGSNLNADFMSILNKKLFHQSEYKLLMSLLLKCLSVSMNLLDVKD